VGTHKDFHVAAVVDQTGRILDVSSWPATPAGYRMLLGWMRRHGELVRVVSRGLVVTALVLSVISSAKDRRRGSEPGSIPAPDNASNPGIRSH
jgi:hypothetical protein